MFIAFPVKKLGWSATIGLVVVLGWQVTDWLMNKYARHHSPGSFASIGCEVFNCKLTPEKDRLRLTLTHTRIDLHPHQPDALRIKVKLVNEAIFAQPWPDLQVTLTDREGRVVGRRTFPPAQYLEKKQSQLLESGELGVVLFDLARPHEKAVGFEVNIVSGPTQP